MITTKEDIIKYFESGVKKTKDFKIGIEHEILDLEAFHGLLPY